MASSKPWNFGAGPAMLPESVLEEARASFVDYAGTRMSLVELSHRDAPVMRMMERAESSLRELLSIPATHEVLFLQGGASTQFAAVPLNLVPDATEASSAAAVYVVNGTWSAAAHREASRYLPTRQVGSCEEALAGAEETAPPAYVYYCDNETVHGVEQPTVPAIDMPSSGLSSLLVCDMSSNFISRPVDVSRFDVILAGAQKNSGIAGLTVVIVRKAVLDRASALTPTMLSWKVAAAAKSSYNTPPVFAIFMAGLVFDWTLQQGGVAAMAALSEAKSQRLYAAIGESKCFKATVPEALRSRMNVVFRLAHPHTGEFDAKLEERFCRQADAKDLKQLSGHRSVGGIRASLYNAMPLQGVEALIDFMKQFEQEITQETQ